MDRIKGQVYKAHSDKYFVKTNDGLIKCTARGLLRLKRDEITVGDIVEVSKNSTIDTVFDRKNTFIRPNVSNVDIIVAVLSPEPKPDFYLLDKLYINAVKEDVDFCIVVNKSDLDGQLKSTIESEYQKLGVEILSVCASTGDGIDQLKGLLKGKLSVLAGQSAAGKTSIVNSMFNLGLKVGELSRKTERGKHTTTRSEIFEFEDVRIIDSPGFAVIEADVDIKDLPNCYPDYVEYASDCRFRGCSHVNEPDCKIKQLVQSGILSRERYARYVDIYNEISKRRTNYEKN